MHTADSHMKVMEIRDKFGVDSLQLVERPDRVPGPGQVLLKMKAFSINYRDLLVVNGVGRWKPPLGRVPVSDGVGIVGATGNGVSRVKVGDRVAPIFYPNWLDGRVVGTSTSIICEGRFAWIGMVIVDSQYRGQGIGTALLERVICFLDSRRGLCMKLDATPPGKPVTRRSDS